MAMNVRPLVCPSARNDNNIEILDKTIMLPSPGEKVIYHYNFLYSVREKFHSKATGDTF